MVLFMQVPMMRRSSSGRATSSRLPHYCGTTIVEILVVVSVIAVLITLLVPALSSAARSARSVACLGNQRQLLVAWTSYVTDYECWPLPIDAQPWRKLDYGWGGVHWFGNAATAGGLLPIPAERPINSYVCSDVRVEWRDLIFKCPLDSGGFDARSLARPWDSASAAR